MVITNQYDFNKDGSTAPNVLDVMALAQLIVDEALTNDPNLTYNVNGDAEGVVDVLDVMTLAQMVVNSANS